MSKTNLKQLQRVSSSKAKLKAKDEADKLMEEELTEEINKIEMSIEALQKEFGLLQGLCSSRVAILKTMDNSALQQLSRLVDDQGPQYMKELEELVSYVPQCQAPNTHAMTDEASPPPNSSDASQPMDLSTPRKQNEKVSFILNPY